MDANFGRDRYVGPWPDYKCEPVRVLHEKRTYSRHKISRNRTCTRNRTCHFGDLGSISRRLWDICGLSSHEFSHLMPLWVFSRNGNTVLHLVAKKNAKLQVEALLRKGCNPDTINSRKKRRWTLQPNLGVFKWWGFWWRLAPTYSGWVAVYQHTILFNLWCMKGPWTKWRLDCKSLSLSWKQSTNMYRMDPYPVAHRN